MTLDWQHVAAFAAVGLAVGYLLSGLFRRGGGCGSCGKSSPVKKAESRVSLPTVR